jgi:hypothetical protein
MMYLAFWKGEGWFGGSLTDAAIRLFSLSNVSHVEMVFPEEDAEGRNLCFSSSPRDGAPGMTNGTRFKYIGVMNDPKWIVVRVPWHPGIVKAFCKRIEGLPYDWAGVLRFAFPFLQESADKYFCSEVCTDGGQEVLQLEDLISWRTRPGDLLKAVRERYASFNQ